MSKLTPRQHSHTRIVYLKRVHRIHCPNLEIYFMMINLQFMLNIFEWSTIRFNPDVKQTGHDSHIHPSQVRSVHTLCSRPFDTLGSTNEASLPIRHAYHCLSAGYIMKLNCNSIFCKFLNPANQLI